MLSNNQIKIINSLIQKKYRQKYNLFVVENAKIIKEILNSDYIIEKIYSIEKTYNLFPSEITEIVSIQELKKISFLKTPQDSLALVHIPIFKEFDKKKSIVALENIQDPGNLGNIIRICDWFGIENILCSNNSVDIFNPKVIQATMGSFLRINYKYTSIVEYIKKYNFPIYIADMKGENIYKTAINSPFMIIFGNEGNGISEELKNSDYQKITIPRIGKAESLNISSSVSIILSEIYRNYRNS